MNRIEKILVIVDPTAEQHPAVSKGALLARRLEARMELFVCDTTAARQTRIADRLRRHPGQPSADPQSTLEQLAEPLRAQGLDVELEVNCAEPLHAALVDRVERTCAELVIKDTHHHSLAQRTFLTNTDWHLIRACPLPLLLTKPRPWASAPQILAAVDPAHTNDKPATLDHHILDHAGLLAKRLGGELHVVHAYLPASLLAATTGAGLATPMTVSEQDLAGDAERARASLQNLASDHRIDASNVHLEVGGPAEALPRFAVTLQADIMAMGAVSRRGFERIFIGSTAETVLEHLPCDALIVKPPDFTARLPF